LKVMPQIIIEKCNGCGLCITVCKCNALVKQGSSITIVEVDNCGWCTQCEAVCPTGAISCPFEIVVEED
jgi:uncharacterized Fe-S center protein